VPLDSYVCSGIKDAMIEGECSLTRCV